MEHRWKKCETPTFSYEGMEGSVEWHTPKSDVYMCENCKQLCLAEVGKPPDEGFMPDLRKCDEAVVDMIQRS